MRQHKRNTLCRLQTKKQREEAGDPAKRPQFVCQGCQKVFPQSSRLLRHQQSCLVRQKLAEFRCDKCTCTYTSHNLYLQHVALCQKAEITSACNKCGLVRIHPSKLQRHVKTCSGVKKHCQHCHTSFLSINLMDCHEASRVCVDPSDERRILCVKCNKAFDTIVQYLQHQWRDALSHRIIEVVNSPENSSSDEGDGALPLEKLFPVKPTSKRRKLDGENLPVCKCCKQLLLWGDRSHLLNCAQSKFWHRDLPLELLRCPRCDRQFPQAHLLNSHASVCRGVISHCHKCHYYFTSARSLEEHLTHSGCLQSRTFKCIRCDNFEGESLEELWIHRGALTKGNSSIPLCETHHSKVHCKHCGEMFAAKGLAVHVRYCESNAGVNASVPKKIINCSRSAAWLGRLNNCSNGIGCGFCSDWFHDRTQLVEHVATEHTEAMTASQAFVWHHKITMLHFPHAAAHINKKSAAASSCQPVKQEMAHQEGTEEASGNNMDDTTDVQEWYDLDENGEYDYSPYFGDVYGVENIPEEDNGLLKLSFTSDPL